uniref:Uncharacterized protein n=1 Tax=Anguilla anguilla TaxID=7936 RepID=A0A0E9SMQ2_ANGAN
MWGLLFARPVLLTPTYFHFLVCTMLISFRLRKRDVPVF